MKNFHLIEITFSIIKPKFFNFFFHWSWKVRKVLFNFFHFILFYRLNYKIKISEILISDNNNNKKLFSDIFNEEIEIVNNFIKIYSIKNFFDVNDSKNKILLEKYVNKENYVYVNESIENYLQVKNEFEKWKSKKEQYNDLEYPLLILSPINLDIDRLGAM